MAPELRNVGASVRARLLTRAREERSDFQLLLTRYVIERLLYRLGASPVRERFVQKGAMLFITWVPDPFRPTRDLDLLGYGDSGVQAVASTFRSICALAVEDDGVAFDTDQLVVAPIREGANYGGVRIRTTATIAAARIPIQIDVGFGDVVTPAPIDIDYPTLFNFPAPHLRAYPAETVVAEKFESIVALGIANSRLKDFYDLWLIAQTLQFDRQLLATAVHRTFEHRQTSLPDEVPTGLSSIFADEKAKGWHAFLTRERLAPVPDNLQRAANDLAAFPMPLIKEPQSPSTWNAGGPWIDSKAEM